VTRAISAAVHLAVATVAADVGVGACAAGEGAVVQEDQWAEKGNVREDPGGSPVLEVGTSLGEVGHSIGEGHWGSRVGQLEGRIAGCPEVGEDSHREGKEEAAGGPEDLEDRATAAVGWAGGRPPEGQGRKVVLEERQGHRGVLRPMYRQCQRCS
jgi:hypothetical protein